MHKCVMKSTVYNALSGRQKYWALHEVNMPRGNGSVDRAPDSQWIKASSKLESSKHSFITNQKAELKKSHKMQ